MFCSRLALALLVVGICACPAWAAPIVLGSSGWSVETLGTGVTVSASVIATGTDYVRISIDKDFGPYQVEDGEIDFPAALLDFTRSPAGAVGRIIIDHENVTNSTGAAWDHFQWDIFQGGSAVFNATASSGWTVTPWFAGWATFNPSGAGYRTVYAHDGPGVANGAVFNPTGGLVIDADGDFTFKQHVTPEPGAMALLAGGALLGLGRRRRCRR